MKQIRVNREAVEINAENERSVLPVFSVVDDGNIEHGNQVIILGACVLKYDPNHTPRVWIETTGPIIWGDRVDPETVRTATAKYDLKNSCGGY